MMTLTSLKFGVSHKPPFFPKVLEPREYAKFFGSQTFNSNAWLETANFNTESLLKSYTAGTLQANAHLFPLAGLIKSMFEYENECVVVDFGGGLGDNFLKIACNFPKENLEKLKYYVIETDALKQKFSHLRDSTPLFERINLFSFEELLNSELENCIEHCHVALFSGSLQYVENWKQTVTQTLKINPDFVYVCRTLFNKNILSFACQQNIVPSAGPWQGRYIGSTGIHIINTDEMKDWFSMLGYEVVNDTFSGDYSNELQSLPEPFRLSEYRDILFQVKN
jgi:putative methyltransferase (TIGR04325 family)